MDTEIIAPHFRVMKQDYAPGRQLRQPAFEVVPNRLVSMEPVDVQKIDGTVRNQRQSIIEGRLRQRGKMTEFGIMPGA